MSVRSQIVGAGGSSARRLSASAASYLSNVAQGALIASLSDPFAGLGLGATSYATFGSVPGQLALNAATIVGGATAPVVDATYTIGVLATSGDGRRKLGDTLSFRVAAAPPVPIVSYASPAVEVGEAGGTVTSTINVDRKGIAGALVINLARAGSATGGSDYALGPASVTIPAGQNSIAFTSATIVDDAAIEGVETIVETATLADYPTSTATLTITITDNDVAAPVNSTAPTISGTPTVGQVLNLSLGTWTNSPTGYARQWKRDGVAIGGATGATYTPVSADVGKVITGTVTAMNAGGSVPATSAGVTIAASSFFGSSSSTWGSPELVFGMAA